MSPSQEETVLLRRPLGKLSHFPNHKAGGTLSVLLLSAAQEVYFTLIYVFPFSLSASSGDYGVFSAQT